MNDANGSSFYAKMADLPDKNYWQIPFPLNEESAVQVEESKRRQEEMLRRIMGDQSDNE